MPASPLVSRKEAHKQRTHHQFVPGIGYLKHSAPPELPDHMAGSKNCKPPTGTKTDTVHFLKPPNGAPPIAMLWIAAEGAWASRQPERGNRLAWSTEHLSRAGWAYVGPDED